jgi:putative transposase
MASRGAPVRVFLDSGSEFSGRPFDLCAYHSGTAIDFNRPGKPTDNCVIGTFNRSLRDECLNVHYQVFSELTPSEFVVKSRHLWKSGVIGGAGI